MPKFDYRRYDDRDCIDCKISFTPFVHNQSRCRVCVEITQIKEGNYNKAANKNYHKACKWCSEEFQLTGPASLYCSSACRRDARLAKLYNLSRPTFLKLTSKKTCDICNEKGFLLNPTYDRKFVIDHDHSTGKVRGWLCHNCNRGLGLFQDNIKLLEKAKSYLEGATTIPEGSTLQAIGSGSAQHSKEE